MRRQAAVVPYVLALVAVVLGVDVLFFRNRFWERRPNCCVDSRARIAA
jgi:hypothetical protein